MCPPIAALPVDLPSAAVTACSEASAEVARFDAELGSELAPFATVLLRSESAASSRIENLTASARALGEATLGGRPGSNAEQVADNVAAMNAAVALGENVSAQAIRAMHHALMARTEPEIAGRWRDQQVWVGGGPWGPHGATFVPPHHSRVPSAIEDLVTFAARTDVEPLAHAAIAHAQFETIHPFVDGNGRTGRALVHAMLRGTGLVRNVTVPVSAGLLVGVDEYFDALTTFRAGDIVPIVERFADASFSAVTNGRQLVSDLRDIRADWAGRIAVRRDSAAWRASELLLRYPVIDAGVVAAELGIAASSVYRTLDPLLAAGVIEASTARRRRRIWHAPEVLAALDAFAARAGKRRRAG